MIEVNIPGQGIYKLKNLVLDLNGTICLDDNIIEGVPERIKLLHNLVGIVIATADTLGTAQELAKSLSVKVYKVDPDDEQAQKLKLVRQMGNETTVSIGNGSNDASMLKEYLMRLLSAAILLYPTLMRPWIYLSSLNDSSQH